MNAMDRTARRVNDMGYDNMLVATDPQEQPYNPMTSRCMNCGHRIKPVNTEEDDALCGDCVTAQLKELRS